MNDSDIHIHMYFIFIYMNEFQFYVKVFLRLTFLVKQPFREDHLLYTHIVMYF